MGVLDYLQYVQFKETKLYKLEDIARFVRSSNKESKNRI